MNVLSLFDGMSCGRIALERAGIEVTNYYASEIDKYAITVSRDNWFDITHIGDVTKVSFKNGWLYTEKGNFYVGKIDLLIGGSPCQGFSFAGKQLNFNDPRSALFFEYVRIMNEIKAENPELKIFLENVRMKKEYQDVISSHLGLQPVFIDSALVSAQTRKRLYWSNIHYTGQPADRGILLGDILETHGTGFVFNRNERNERNEKVMCIDANYYKGADNHGQRTMISCLQVGLADDIKGYDSNRRIYSAAGKCPTLISCTGGHKTPKVEVIDVYLTDEEIKRGLIKHSAKTWKSGNRMGNMKFPNDLNAKAKCITSVSIKGARETNHVEIEGKYRKLTPVECERAQTVDDNYTSAVSATQRFKMLGNGWNVETIVHLIKPLKDADIL